MKVRTTAAHRVLLFVLVTAHCLNAADSLAHRDLALSPVWVCLASCCAIPLTRLASQRYVLALRRICAPSRRAPSLRVLFSPRSLLLLSCAFLLRYHRHRPQDSTPPYRHCERVPGV